MVVEDKKHVQYATVKKWTALLKTTCLEMDGIRDALAAATDDAIDSFSPLLTE